MWKVSCRYVHIWYYSIYTHSIYAVSGVHVYIYIYVGVYGCEVQRLHAYTCPMGHMTHICIICGIYMCYVYNVCVVCVYYLYM